MVRQSDRTLASKVVILAKITWYCDAIFEKTHVSFWARFLVILDFKKDVGQSVMRAQRRVLNSARSNIII